MLKRSRNYSEGESGGIYKKYLIDRTAEEVTSLENQGLSKPALVGRLEFTLWRDGRREIRKLW
jgi:hypothetical protein